MTIVIINIVQTLIYQYLSNIHHAYSNSMLCNLHRTIIMVLKESRKITQYFIKNGFLKLKF